MLCFSQGWCGFSDPTFLPFQNRTVGRVIHLLVQVLSTGSNLPFFCIERFRTNGAWNAPYQGLCEKKQQIMFAKTQRRQSEKKTFKKLSVLCGLARVRKRNSQLRGEESPQITMAWQHDRQPGSLRPVWFPD